MAEKKQNYGKKRNDLHGTAQQGKKKEWRGRRMRTTQGRGTRKEPPV